MDFKEVSFDSKSKIKVSFVNERKGMRGIFWTAQGSVAKKKDAKLDWSKDNVEYDNYNLTSFNKELKNNTKIILSDFKFEIKKYTSKKDNQDKLSYNIIVNEFEEYVYGEQKPAKATPVESDELPF